MTSRPPPRTRSTLSKRSVSTSRNSMSAQLSRETNFILERGDGPVPFLPSPAPAEPAALTSPHQSQPAAGGVSPKARGQGSPPMLMLCHGQW